MLRYREALLYGFQAIRQKGPLSANIICRIQEILEGNTAPYCSCLQPAMALDLLKENTSKMKYYTNLLPLQSTHLHVPIKT